MTSPTKVGLVIGALLGGWHLAWIILILLGWAQPILDFIFWAHMIQPVYKVQPFNAAAAGILILITFGIGYVLGLIGGIIWNRLHR